MEVRFALNCTMSLCLDLPLLFTRSSEDMLAKIKSFIMNHTAHRASLISCSLSLSQVLAYSARPRIRD